MGTIRWGMIGCGAVTEVKSGPPLYSVPGSALVAVASRNAASARDYAQRHGVRQVFEDIDELIASDEVDAVYVATPPASHSEYALKVARAGKPCCVEKPMAMDHAECMAMVSAFAARDLPLFVSYYRRSLPRFVAVKQWLEEDLIGEVREVSWHLVKPPSPRDLAREPNWRTQPETSPGGYFSDLASHGIDLFQFLLGDIEAVQGFATNQQGLYRAEDAVAACWRFAGGALGTGSWNFGGDHRSDEVRIVGGRGVIRFSVFDEAPLEARTGKEQRSVSIPNPAHIQTPHVENMVRHLRGGAPHPSLGIEAAKTSWVMGEILRARTER
ncbi:Gfo/Idh/MocA family protein [Lysobacter korlensis]|uniref:Gfo/Idh/MocA family protein n=1 Tax=Lysobacter korlensis TaxID=553636 RepID=A0ABV6RRG3_9GAMM